MLYLFVYLLGFLLTYYVVKLYRKKHNDDSWEDVFYTISFALVSWGAVITILFGLFIQYVIKPDNFSGKPPKWL